MRRALHAFSTRLYHPAAHCRGYTWIGDERIAIGAMPCREEMDRLGDGPVSHVVNCRARLQTVLSQDLSLERDQLGADRVAHAPMWDNGKPQAPEKWADAALFAVSALDDDPEARILIHCQQGRRRSAMVSYAVLRLRGRSSEEAARAILEHRTVARIVPAYRTSVERWLAARENS